jgi:heme exporter protein A
VSSDFAAVEVRGLVKLFGATRALAGVDARFEAGAVTVIEGPNGSGKTTLLSVLSLLTRPTRGEVRFGDKRVVDQPELRGRIGLVGHAGLVYPDLNAQENLELFASLYRVADASKRIAELTERFGLGSWSTRPVRTYSRGQLQRLSLARALVHRPKLLLLDEPSTGLDVASTERLIEAILVEKAAGVIAVLVTHDPTFASRVADRTVRLDRGRIAEGVS